MTARADATALTLEEAPEANTARPGPSQSPAEEPGFRVTASIGQKEGTTAVAVGMEVKVQPQAPLEFWRKTSRLSS